MTDIASLVVTPVIKSAVETAGSLIKSQYDLLKGEEGDLEKLKSKLTAIQAVLQDAEDKQSGSQQLRDWLGKLEEAAYDVEDLLETFEAQLRLLKQVKPLPGKESAFKIAAAKKIRQLFERLDEIEKQKASFGLNNIVVNNSCYDRRTTMFVNETDVVGREEDTKAVIDMLLSEEFDREGCVSVVSVTGMGGLGKTTLAQVVHKNERITGKFSIFMWVCVTDNFNYLSILKEMIESHSKMKLTDIDPSSPDLLESRLEDIILRKKILLVLDDVWTESYDDWDKLHRLLKRSGEGSKVLVTSRSTNVFSLNTPSVHKLGHLPEDDCWSLFKSIAFTEQNGLGNMPANDLEVIGKQIVRKCEGLPLAVKAMGGLLRGNNDVKKWRKIVNDDIWKAEIPTTRTQKAIILPALKLSYDHLPSTIKKCFGYCYIFPKSYVFNKMELIKLWKGASIFPPNPQSTTDELGSEYFDVLLRMSFFQLSKVHNEVRYLMHDLIHDLAQSVSIPHCLQVDDKKECLSTETSRHVSVLCEKAETPLQQITDKSKKLRTLLAPTGQVKDFGQSLDRFFQATKFVRVLDLSSSTVLELPKSVGELMLLRYLDVSGTEIRQLPESICNLYHLQTLKMLNCPWLFQLPKNLANLVNLENLEINDIFWYKCSVLPPRIGSLSNLRNLHAFPLSPKEGCGITELKHMKHLTGALRISNLEHAVNAVEADLASKENLVEVTFEWSYASESNVEVGDDHEKILEDLQPHSNIEKLKILQYRGKILPSWLRHGTLTNLVSISFKYCTNCEVLSWPPSTA